MNRFSHKYRFADWSPKLVPSVAAGVYAIWESELLVYCGMSGRGLTPESALQKKRHGLVTRLNSHASGRLSGDQFCVYVANRLVIPQLNVNHLSKFSTGELSLDALTKQYIYEKLDFQFAVTQSGEDAFRLEAECRSGQIFGCKPKLNPL